MKKAYYIQLFAIISCFIIFLFFMTSILCYQCSTDEPRIKQFYNEKENSMNVVLYGPSSVRADFIPTQAYENYGITSYNYSVNQCPLPAIKYMIKESIKTQSPEVLVIDINGITYCNEAFTVTKSLTFTENIKNSDLKKEVRKSLLKMEDKIENNIQFYNYHSNWSSISLCLKFKNFFDKFGDKPTYLKGYTTNLTSINNIPLNCLVDSKTINDFVDFNEYELTTINELLYYCKSLQPETKILFVKFPRPVIKNDTEWEIPYINSMEKMIKDNGFKFVDFTLEIEEIGLNYQKDFCDKTHLNHFGAEKFTNYLSQYLLNNFTINTTHPNNVKEEWDNCVETTNNFYEHIKTKTLTNNKSFEYEISLYEFLGKL